MLFYDWKKINRFCGRSSGRIYLALQSMLMTGPPRNRWDPLYNYYQKDFTGNSFLVNPYDLLRSGASYKEIAEYVALASFRNYSTYATTKDATLDLLHSPVGQDAIESNRLLSIKDGRVLFQYEEVIKGE